MNEIDPIFFYLLWFSEIPTVTSTSIAWNMESGANYCRLISQALQFQ